MIAIELDDVAGGRRIGGGNAKGPLVGKWRDPGDDRSLDVFNGKGSLLPRWAERACRTADNPEIEDRGR